MGQIKTVIGKLEEKSVAYNSLMKAFFTTMIQICRGRVYTGAVMRRDLRMFIYLKVLFSNYTDNSSAGKKRSNYADWIIRNASDSEKAGSVFPIPCYCS